MVYYLVPEEEGMMLKQEYRAETDEREAAECRHHWVIEAASGPISRGRCRVCGAEKEFQNYIEDAPWSEAVASSSGINDVLSSIELPQDEGMD